MGTQDATNPASWQLESDDLHAHSLSSRKPEFVQSQRLTSSESKKFRLKGRFEIRR